jgi:aldose 1-epimerase
VKRTAERRSKAAVVLGVSMMAGAPAAPAAQAPAAFSAEAETDRETGWAIIVLRHQDPATPSQSHEARIAPAAGGNLFSWQLDGTELLHQPDPLADLIHQRAGTPLMYPTVNRVRDGRMSFEGRQFTFPPNAGPNFIHGLARRCAFTVGQLSKGARAAAAEIFLDWDERQPDWSQFPIKHRLTLTFTLRKSALSIGYRVDNQDASKLPYAFGLHPYFRIPGPRDQVTVTSPLTKRMQAQEFLPTGELLAVAGTAHDLRRPLSLAGLALDDVYLGMTPEKVVAFTLGPDGPRVTLGGSPEFTHLVVYTPPDRPFFCLENQTSSTDAHNLWARGKKREAHLLVVAAGKSGGGEVTWTVRRPR